MHRFDAGPYGVALTPLARMMQSALLVPQITHLLELRRSRAIARGTYLWAPPKGIITFFRLLHAIYLMPIMAQWWPSLHSYLSADSPLPWPNARSAKAPAGLGAPSGMQVTSHWLSDTGLLLLRCVQLLFFAVTLTLEGTTGESAALAHAARCHREYAGSAAKLCQRSPISDSCKTLVASDLVKAMRGIAYLCLSATLSSKLRALPAVVAC